MSGHSRMAPTDSNWSACRLLHEKLLRYGVLEALARASESQTFSWINVDAAQRGGGSGRVRDS